MIDYDRGSWYGIHLLFRLRGSLLPRCVPSLYGAGAGDNPVRVWLLNGTAENTFQLSPAASPRRGGRLAQAREQVEAAEADPQPPRLAAEVAAEAEEADDDMSAEDDYGIEP